MKFKAEITGIQKGYGSTYTVSAEGRWEGFEAEKNVTLSLQVPPEKVKEFRVGDGVVVELLTP